MSKFIEVVSTCMDKFRWCLEPEQAKRGTFEATQSVRDALEDLKEADMYYLSDTFKDALMAFHNEIVDTGQNSNEVVFSEDCRLPSKLCFITLDVFESKAKTTGEISKTFGKGHCDGFLCKQSEDGTIMIRLIGHQEIPYMIGAYNLNRGGIQFPSSKVEELNKDERLKYQYLEFIVSIAGAFSLINQPRFVDVLKSGSRQQRRRVQKQHGVDVEQWHEISWNIDEPIEGEVDDRGRSFHMPLHYTRGHWRKAKPHWDNVVIRKDGLHYIWIDGFWSGHPAYGIKKGYHAPKLGKAA